MHSIFFWFCFFYTSDFSRSQGLSRLWGQMVHKGHMILSGFPSVCSWLKKIAKLMNLYMCGFDLSDYLQKQCRENHTLDHYTTCGGDHRRIYIKCNHCTSFTDLMKLLPGFKCGRVSVIWTSEWWDLLRELIRCDGLSDLWVLFGWMKQLWSGEWCDGLSYVIGWMMLLMQWRDERCN